MPTSSKSAASNCAPSPSCCKKHPKACLKASARTAEGVVAMPTSSESAASNCAASPSCCKKHPKACLKASAQATKFEDLPPGVYREWVPQRRASPTVCMVSVVTMNLLKSWGGHAVEQNANWAVAHGYKYCLFTALLLQRGLHPVWSNPRATLYVLQQGERECATVFFVDGDAVVHGVGQSLRQIIGTFLPVGGPDILMSCHSPFGELGKCHVGDGCQCCRAAARGCTKRKLASMIKREVTGAMVVPYCHINSGAYLASNNGRTLEMMRWWAFMKGCVSKTSNIGAPEQACAIRMKNRWPFRVDVVGGRLFNTPAWFHTHFLSARDPVQAYERARAKVLVHPNASDMSCFDDPSSFVCHIWNAVRLPRPQLQALRSATFNREIDARRPLLRALVAARGERYVNVSELLA